MGEHTVAARSCGRSSPVALAFEPVVENNPICRDTGPLWHPTFHSLPSLCYSRYTFINQPVWEDEQLGELCAACLSSRASWFVVRRANHCTTEALYVVFNIVTISTSNNVTVKDCSWKNVFIIVVQTHHMLYKISTFIILHFYYFIKTMWITINDFSRKYLCCYQGRAKPTVNHYSF